MGNDGYLEQLDKVTNRALAGCVLAWVSAMALIVVAACTGDRTFYVLAAASEALLLLAAFIYQSLGFRKARKGLRARSAIDQLNEVKKFLENWLQENETR